MSIQISHEIEARLTDEARRQGISVDALLERLISERPVTVQTAKSELPIWHLGSIGSFHRRDIYEHAR